MEGSGRHIPSSLIGALTLHALVLGLLTWGLNSPPSSRDSASPRVQVVKASVIDVQELERRREAKRRVEELARQKVLETARRAEAERRRAEEARRQVELQKEQERQRREAERHRKAEQEKKRLVEKKAREEAERRRKQREAELKKKEAERKQREAEERRRAQEAARVAKRKREEAARRKAAQERLAAAVAAEAAAEEAAEGQRRQRELASLTQRYRNAITAKVERMWRRPAGARSGDSCVVHVIQTPAGFIQEIQLLDCRGDERFRRSVRAAVLKAEPLPRAPDPQVFDREIRFVFQPEGR